MSDLHAALIPTYEPLSVEYLYHHAVQRSGANPHDGVNVKAIGDALLHDGQTKESHWPYLLKLPTDLALWVPPPNPTPLYKRKHKLLPGTFKKAMDLVQADTPTVMIMSISDAFFQPMSDHSIDSTEPVDPTRKHAVVVIGAGTRSGMDFLLVRSSWGEDWGLEGCAWVSERYIAPRIRSLIQLLEAA